MSPIIGLLIAIVAGFLAPRPRTAAAIVVPPMLGATAAQSWYLGTGRGHNPASTTTDSPGYWIVQVLIIIAICGVAAAICWVADAPLDGGAGSAYRREGCRSPRGQRPSPRAPPRWDSRS